MTAEDFRWIMAETLKIVPEAVDEGWHPHSIAVAIADECPCPEDEAEFLQELRDGKWDEEIAAQLGYR